MQDSASSIVHIPASAARVAEAAKHIKDEFDAVGELRFPSLLHSEPLLGGNFAGSLSCSYQIIVFGNDAVRLTQLYVKVSNRSEHRLVQYDTAVLPGGEALDLKHINFEREANLFDNSITAYTEHLGVALTPQMLADYISKPMRIKISNPRQGVQFVVEIPSDYVAGVLYRLSPEKYEVEAEPLIAVEPQPNSGKSIDPHWFKHSVWTAIGMGFIGAHYVGTFTGIFLAILGFMFAAWYLRNFYRE